MKRVEEVTIENKEYEIYVGALEFIHFEDEYERITKKESTFLEQMQKAEKGSMKAIVMLLGSALHEKGKMKPVGVDYLNKNIDVMSNINELMEALGKSMISNQVKAEKDEKK